MTCKYLAVLLVSAILVIMGNRKHLILLPGLLCDKALWAHQLKTLSDVANMTVADLTKDDSINGMAKRILTNAPKFFSLAGLSMGGYVAQEIMRLAPERVERLALINTSAKADTPKNKKHRLSFIAQLSIGSFRGVTKKLLPYLIYSDRLSDEILISTIEMSAANVGQKAFLRQQKAILSRIDGLPYLKNIKCPTLVLCGRQDTLTPPSEHEEIANKIQNASLVLIEDCGHLSPLERPYAVSAVMRYWLTN